MQPFDPLDPEQRAERGRERTAFFRQTDLFPVVVLTMIVFVPLAMWQAPLAIPFLGWMAVMVHVMGGADRVIAHMRAKKPLLGGRLIRSALTCAGIFLATSLVLSPTLLWLVGAGFVLLYVYGLMTGRLWADEDQK